MCIDSILEMSSTQPPAELHQAFNFFAVAARVGCAIALWKAFLAGIHLIRPWIENVLPLCRQGGLHTALNRYIRVSVCIPLANMSIQIYLHSSQF
jgi:hypothetical protein